jgi:DNA-binding response OmpR family regulator
MDKKKILVVDDEMAIAKFVKLMLERSGRYEVQCETEGLKAVSAAKTFKPDLILLDVNLPDAQGGEISTALQDEPALRHIPVVFLTGMLSNEESREGLMIGGRPAVAKPIDMSRLVDCIEKNLA